MPWNTSKHSHTTQYNWLHKNGNVVPERNMHQPNDNFQPSKNVTTFCVVLHAYKTSVASYIWMLLSYLKLAPTTSTTTELQRDSVAHSYINVINSFAFSLHDCELEHVSQRNILLFRYADVLSFLFWNLQFIWFWRY